MVGNVADGPTSRVSIRGLWYVVASATPAKPRLVDPQIFFVWQASPKLLRAEASIAAQFAAKMRLVRIASFGRDACPVHTQLRGVRSQQQSVFRPCKPPQRARGPTGHSAHLSFKLASAPPFKKKVRSRYGGSRPLAVSLGRAPRYRSIPRSGGVPTRLQELLDSPHTVFIGRRVKHIERHGLPRII